MPSNLERRLEQLERQLHKDHGSAAPLYVETLIDLSLLTDAELQWLEDAWEGVPIAATAAEKHPEKFEEIKRRLAILIKETEHRR